MNLNDQQAFDKQRARLTSIAYRMMGEVSAAEDIVQDAWIAWNNAERLSVDSPAAWLNQVTTRLAIDSLRSARVRRERYIGPWLPEPLMESDQKTPEDSYAHARECELALLWAMEKLSPEERSAFILRKAFDSDYSEIATTLSKSASACRKLVSRAKQKIRLNNGLIEIKTSQNNDMLMRFAQACASQDHQEILTLLAPNVVAVSDGGGKVRAALRPLVGEQEVAKVLTAIAAKSGNGSQVEFAILNGQGALSIQNSNSTNSLNRSLTTVRTNAEGLIDWIYILRNPEKLPQY